jgi:hypothetical protein
MEHSCINHNKKYPDNLMACFGQLCSDCPFSEEFKKRGLRKSVKIQF